MYNTLYLLYYTMYLFCISLQSRYSGIQYSIKLQYLGLDTVDTVCIRLYLVLVQIQWIRIVHVGGL